MSEHLAADRQFVLAHQTPPRYTLEGRAYVANKLGRPDTSDGVRTIADFTIQTPQELALTRTDFSHGLRAIRRQGLDLPTDIAEPLQIKASMGMLNQDEIAFSLFGFPEDTTTREKALALAKYDTNLGVRSLRAAQQLGLASIEYDVRKLEKLKKHSVRATVTWRGQVKSKMVKRTDTKAAIAHAFLKSYAEHTDIDFEAIEPPSYVLTPHNALEGYIAEYGGAPVAAATQAEAREHLARRYQEDLQDEVFYPDPLKALPALYYYREPRWSQVQHSSHFVTTDMYITRSQHGPLEDRYTVHAEGPSARASRQAAARLILRNIGATDLSLLHCES